MTAQRAPEVAITGVGAVTPFGRGADVLLERWTAGESAIVDGRAWCADFNAGDVLSNRERRATERFAQLAAVACDEAMRQAGWDRDPPCAPERIACVIGTALGGIAAALHEHVAFLGPGRSRRLSPLAMTRLMPNAAAAALALRHGWRGESLAVVSACSGGAQAIGVGLRLIRSGAVEAAAVGGADAQFPGLVAALFETMGGTSRSRVPRPFDRRRDGFVSGEGAGILLLEKRELAHARGARPLGSVVGFAATTDAHHLAVPRPGGEGIAAAMRGALRDAGLDPGRVAYVNAHGTATQRNDGAEARAIASVLGTDGAGAAQVSSLKSAAGHLQGAAGAVEAIATLGALRAGVAPPTIGLEQTDVIGARAYVRERAVPLDATCGAPFVGLSNSSGLGGHNATLVLRAA